MGQVLLADWQDRWQRPGLPAHPLLPNGKAPVCKGWQMRPPGDQWREARELGDRPFNLGVLPGKAHAMIDCDALTTAASVGAGLAGRGIRSYEELTWRGMPRYWLRVDGTPEGDKHELAPEIGPGHILTGRWNCVVSCSVIDGQRYRPAGEDGPESIQGLRVVAWRDLEWLLPMTVGQTPTQAPVCTDMPLQLLRRDAPLALAMLADLAGWPAGIPYLSYKSASEAEAAAVAEMILAGWRYDAIKAAFDKHSPGSYIRNLRGRYGYLQRTYRRVLSHLAATPPRPDLAAAYQSVQSTPWPGRGGALDKAVLSGLLAIAWQWKSTSVFASVRDLAAYAAAGIHGVHNSLDRLQAAGLIRRLGWQNGTLRYDVSPLVPNGNISHIPLPDALTPKGGEGGKDDVKVGVKSAGAGLAENLPGGNELWGAGLLGRSAGAVYSHLGDDPVGAGELAERTGKHRHTVERALHRLVAVGLAERVVGGWARGPGDVAAVASTQGAPLHQRLRHERHERERLAWSDTKARAQ
jgi:hypothetical protein